VREARIAVVGATGAVGAVTMRLLRARGHENVRAFASGRSAGREVDLALFSVGTSASRELVPHAVRGGAVAVDKSAAYRLQDGVPLVVPEVNGSRARANDGVVANPNCCTIPLTCVLGPLHEAAGLKRVRVSTYQSVSGAGARRMEALLAEPQADHDLAMDWTWDGDETDEESKIRAETRKILELPELPISATTVRGCERSPGIAMCSIASATRALSRWLWRASAIRSSESRFPPKRSRSRAATRN